MAKVFVLGPVTGRVFVKANSDATGIQPDAHDSRSSDANLPAVIGLRLGPGPAPHHAEDAASHCMCSLGSGMPDFQPRRTSASLRCSLILFLCMATFGPLEVNFTAVDRKKGHNSMNASNRFVLVLHARPNLTVAWG